MGLTQFVAFATINYMNSLSVHPEVATKRLLGVLSKRMKDIVELRFGLGRSGERLTLEAIGNKYDITRERVRQIEADALSRIRKSPAIKELEGVFVDVEHYFVNAGGVVREASVLSALASHSKHENHVSFLLTLHNGVNHYNENDTLHSRWAQKKEASEQAERTLTHAANVIRQGGKTIPEAQLFDVLSASARNVLGATYPQPVLAHWLEISKILGKNYFGEWGLIEFPTVKPRGVRDLSYLVMARANAPMHFAEVAHAISDLTGKRAHVQTVHNELIKDNRFVLVGRGLYALRECGYEEGTVKDIIAGILKKNGPLSKETVVKLVSEKRLVKPNTIAVNLDNKKFFRKTDEGMFSVC